MGEKYVRKPDCQMCANRTTTSSFNIPEGRGSFRGPWDDNSTPIQTPTPVMMDPYVPDRSVHLGSSSFLAALAIILGIVISTGTILAVVGKAFYVERSEYNLATVVATEDKTKVSETLKQLRDTLTRQETSLQKLSDDIGDIKQNLASMRGRR
jgi:hypothetical protein